MIEGILAIKSLRHTPARVAGNVCASKLSTNHEVIIAAARGQAMYINDSVEGSSMRIKDFILPVILVGLVFVGFGDRFLPAPLSTASASSREQLDTFFKGLFTGFSTYNRYHKTEQMIREAERAEGK
jgi:hypothetical protein